MVGWPCCPGPWDAWGLPQLHGLAYSLGHPGAHRPHSSPLPSFPTPQCPAIHQLARGRRLGGRSEEGLSQSVPILGVTGQSVMGRSMKLALMTGVRPLPGTHLGPAPVPAARAQQATAWSFEGLGDQKVKVGVDCMYLNCCDAGTEPLFLVAADEEVGLAGGPQTDSFRPPSGGCGDGSSTVLAGAGSVARASCCPSPRAGGTASQESSVTPHSRILLARQAL